MEVLLKGKLIDVDCERWDFEGKTGIRYYGVIKGEDKKLVTFKIDESEYKFFSDLLGDEISITCKIFVRGTYSLKVTSVN